MSKHSNTTAAIVAVSDQAIAVMKQHERDEHDGERCPYARSMTVATIAYALELEPDEWMVAQELWIGMIFEARARQKRKKKK